MQSDWKRAFAVINCELKMHGNSHFSLYVSFYTISSETATSEKPLGTFHYCVHPWACLTTPYERFSWNFFLFWLSVHMQKNQCDPVIPSGGICDQRFLQTNWLKAFPAITQGKEFFQTWDLYSQIDNNNNCYLRTFPAKINYKIFHNNGKTLFLCHVYFFVVFTQRQFLLKNVSKYNCSGPSAFKCQKWRIDWQATQKLFFPSMSACKNHSINLLISPNHLWDTLDSEVPWSIRPPPFLTTSTP